MFNKLYYRLKKFWNEDVVNRYILIVLGALIVVSASFAGYYYWDRYVRLGDKSPLELGVEQLEDVVLENPEDPEARVALAQYYFDNGAHPQAIEQAQQVLNAYPENDSALFILGMSYLMSGQLDEGVPHLENFAAVRREGPMAQSDTQLETALYFLGESYIHQGEDEKAIQVLSEALTINRTDADAMYQLGLAYARTGQHQAAVDQFHNAVRFVPDFAEVYHGMYESYAALEQPAYVAYARGMEAFSLADYETAQIHLEAAAVDLPDYTPVHLGLGLLYEQLGDLDAAIASLEIVIQLEPDNFMANNALGRIRLMLDNEEANS